MWLAISRVRQSSSWLRRLLGSCHPAGREASPGGALAAGDAARVGSGGLRVLIRSHLLPAPVRVADAAAEACKHAPVLPRAARGG